MTSSRPDPGLVARLRTAGCVFAEEEAALLEAEPVSEQEREKLVVRRLAGEPLELILGWAEFCGLRIRVAPGVFVPRRRSALVVDLVEARLRGVVSPKVLDLCCGTGALGVAIASRVPGAEVWAVDVDPVAVECARRNLSAVGVSTGSTTGAARVSTSSTTGAARVSTSSTTGAAGVSTGSSSGAGGARAAIGDLFDPLPDDLELDAIMANAPYVPSSRIQDMPPEARDHEHRVALDGGEDGLDVQRRVIEQAPKHLVPGGVLVIETGQEQAPATASLMESRGLVAEIHHDEELYATAVTGVAL